MAGQKYLIKEKENKRKRKEGKKEGKKKNEPNSKWTYSPRRVNNRATNKPHASLMNY